MALGTQRGDLALGRNVSMSSPWRTPLTICLFGAVTFASRSTIPNRAPLAHPVTLFVKLVLQDDLRDVQQHHIQYNGLADCALHNIYIESFHEVQDLNILPLATGHQGNFDF